MGRNSGGVRGNSTRTQTAEKYNHDIGVTVQSIKGALLSYSQTDRLNRSTAYHLGFNADAQGLVEDLARGEYGLASTIAKQAVERPGWNRYGARFSEKQAYVMAKAAYDNKVVKNGIIFKDNSKEAAQMDARQREARHARNERRQERDNAVATKNGLRSISKGERISAGSKLYDKSGNSYELVKRNGDLIKVKDSSGRVTTIYKKKLYLKK